MVVLSHVCFGIVDTCELRHGAVGAEIFAVALRALSAPEWGAPIGFLGDSTLTLRRLQFKQALDTCFFATMMPFQRRMLYMGRTRG